MWTQAQAKARAEKGERGDTRETDKEISRPRSEHRGGAYCVFNALYDTAVGKCVDAMGSENGVRCVALYACVR